MAPKTDPPASDVDRASGPDVPFQGEGFRALFEAVPDACMIVDEAGDILDMNREVERMFGYAREELVGSSVEVLIPDAMRSQHRAHRDQYAEAPSRRPMGIGMELIARRKDRSHLPVEVGLSPLRTAHGVFVVATVHDITSRARLREFGAGVLKGAEEERQRIARDLHDDTAQRLASILLRLQMARRTRAQDRREELLTEIHRELHETSEGVRRILRGLRPPALEEAGVVAAIRAHLRNVFGDTELEADLEAADIDDLLSLEAKLSLYRIVQEAVTNIVRHASATIVRIRLSASNDAIRAIVEDNGRGFSVEDHAVLGGGGLGMLGMQERAAILGGHVQIESKAGAGTRVEIELPLSPRMS
jgi:PAS domain S-box-containing protein